ncbi:hypothetical protein [Streptomyces sp. NBC_01190]|uniref:hypothetical protein n=1 Tax=Streptomyces sp. NBC_01190 TaxID=2903767 RepID=UPI0038704948|nr:hypothetical protein OG519_29160 [Streptomyces sp. NBC_01190]
MEEALAWLLRRSGYELLTSVADDPVELSQQGKHTLFVQGRGARHQVDVLGQFAFTPAFSLPIRLFLEAKFRDTPCRLRDVRQAHGLIRDVNENFATGASGRPRRRYQYSYALFSTSGFTKATQEYALAHQISLVDLSGASFRWLLDPVRESAGLLFESGLGSQSRNRVTWMRSVLRTLLETGGDSAGMPFSEERPGALHAAHGVAGQFVRAALPSVVEFATKLQHHQEAEMLIGFPAAPFILPLTTLDGSSFVAYAEEHPAHRVMVRRSWDESAEWTLVPADDAPRGYLLTFTLPEYIEAWIGEASDGKERGRISQVKGELLSRITVYRMVEDEVRTFQLRYEPRDLRRD